MKQCPPPKEQTNKQTNQQTKTKKREKTKKTGGPFLKKLPYYLKLSASGVKRKQKLDFCVRAH